MQDYSKTPLSQTLGAKPGTEVLVLFTTSREELERGFEAVQRIGLDAGLVDDKSCSIDDRWQALRFVRRGRHRR